MPREKNLRFSLKSLLGLVLVAAVPLALFFKTRRAAKIQAELIAELQSVGAMTRYEYEYGTTGDLDDPRFGYPYLYPNEFDQTLVKQAEPNIFARSLGKDFFHTVAMVDIPDLGIEQNNLLGANVMQLADLQSLTVHDISATVLEPLQEFEKLHRFVIWSTANSAQLAYVARSRASEIVLKGHVNDAQLTTLSSSTHLRHLFANFRGENSYSDAGLKSISSLDGLRSLWLSSDFVTQDGLKYLKSQNELSWLYLRLPNAVAALGDILQDKPIVHLKIQDMYLDAESIDSIATLRKLRHLVLLDSVGPDLRSELIASLAKLGSLKFLSCDGIELTEQDISLLFESGMEMIYCETNANDAALSRIVNSYGGMVGRTEEGVAVEFFSNDGRFRSILNGNDQEQVDDSNNNVVPKRD